MGIIGTTVGALVAFEVLRRAKVVGEVKKEIKKLKKDTKKRMKGGKR